MATCLHIVKPLPMVQRLKLVLFQALMIDGNSTKITGIMSTLITFVKSHEH